MRRVAGVAVLLSVLVGASTAGAHSARLGEPPPLELGAEDAVLPELAVSEIEPPQAQEAAPDSLARGQLVSKGLASWYGEKFHGRRTASGERYDKNAFTAAHKTLPFGSLVRVKSVRSGKEVVVRINDRGPYKRKRVIDLSSAAAAALGIKGRGIATVVLLRE